MTQRLRMKGIEAPRIAVQAVMKILRPQEAERKKRRRLRRRDYVSPGPNFAWHVDGYDKLKPFGFAIHGAIDGFSRRILWLEVGPSNNNPQVIALYFVRTVLQLEKAPCVLRCDRGTENVHIEKIQKHIRHSHDDEFAGEMSFVYGKSTANQRIEAFWAILRKQCAGFWIDMFKNMSTLGLIDMSDKVHIECLRYCFMHLIFKDIERMAIEWNTHRICRRRNQLSETGVPDIMFFTPEAHGTRSYHADINEHDLKELETELELDEGEPPPFDPDIVKIISEIIPDVRRPSDVESALDLYTTVIGKISGNGARLARDFGKQFMYS